MRILLDESLPRKLKDDLPEHKVVTVPEAGWASRRNGELLRLADAHFDVFVTPDRHLSEQQNLTGLRLILVVLRARSNDITDLRPLMADLLSVLPRLQPGQIFRLGA